MLDSHVMRKKGSKLVSAKTVCVSAVLAHFGIHPKEYHSTWTAKSGNRWPQILRTKGYGVRSRKSSLPNTMSALRLAVKRLSDPYGTTYAVTVSATSNMTHLVLLDRTGRILVDTSPRICERRKVIRVMAVIPKR